MDDKSAGDAAESAQQRFRQVWVDRMGRRAEGLKGTFGGALWQQLCDLAPELTNGQAPSPDAIAACFIDCSEDAVEILFLALSEACGAGPRLGAAESEVLAELMICAAMRSIDTNVWNKPAIWQGDIANRMACVHDVPTSSSLLAAIGFAGLFGLVLRAGSGAAPDGVYDLSDVMLHNNVPEAVLGTLYDEAFKATTTRPNPDVPLTDQERGKLRNHFDKLRIKKKAVTVYVRLPEHLDSFMQRSVLSSVAQAINSRVVQGSRQNDQKLVLPATNFTCESLEEKIREILVHTGVVAGTPAPLPPGPSPTPEPAPPASPPAEPAYSYHLFISHASEDKASFVDGLVKALQASGLSIWYDKEQLKLGDSISDRINRALTESRHGLVVFSPHFLAKNWPQAEQQALFSLSLQSGRKRLLPVLHGVTVEQVSQRLPLLADRLFCDTKQGMPAVIKQILDAVT